MLLGSQERQRKRTAEPTPQTLTQHASIAGRSPKSQQAARRQKARTYRTWRSPTVRSTKCVLPPPLMLLVTHSVSPQCMLHARFSATLQGTRGRSERAQSLPRTTSQEQCATEVAASRIRQRQHQKPNRGEQCFIQDGARMTISRKDNAYRSVSVSSGGSSTRCCDSELRSTCPAACSRQKQRFDERKPESSARVEINGQCA